jgi:Rha family phage regulatory protein
MNFLVKIEEKETIGFVVSSRTVAEQLGKRHADVLESVGNILENGDFRSLIIPSTYKVSGQKREYKEYLLTKDGFVLYMFNIQGHNDFKMAYIKKFNEMEKQLKERETKVFTQNNLKEMLLLSLELIEKNEKLVAELKEKEKIIESQKEKVEFAEMIEKNQTTISLDEMAHILRQNGIRITSYTLRVILREHGFLGRRNGTGYNMPTQKSISAGYMRISRKIMGHVYSTTTGGITGKGQIFFVKFFKKLLKNNQMFLSYENQDDLAKEEARFLKK